MKNNRVIVAGGAGYIGSHVCVDLINNGYDLLVIDDFSNSSPESLNRVREITQLTDQSRLGLLQADLASPADYQKIVDTIKLYKPAGAIHLAGLKAVGESVAEPGRYYRININATHTLIDGLDQADGRMIVFSSSATVYGDHNKSPVDETGRTGPTNPYGQTKFFIEQILTDTAISNPHWKICNLRYFNPVGADVSGLIGEDPNGIPNNLFPYIAQVAIGRREKLSVYGDDYPTPDGTGIRDYIHVCDLANGHVKALNFLEQDGNNGSHIFNLGTGVGVSVLDAVKAFEKASGKKVPYEIIQRREGDIAEIYADASQANKILGWQATRTMDDMCRDHWHWQSQNPNGYGDIKDDNKL